MIRSNLHTHTVFSDGRDTPEEMVEAALSRGFESLGFSDHAFSPLYAEGSMPLSRFGEYKDEIRRLKEKFHGKIRIFTGIENDSLYPFEPDGLDYVIGSVHDVPLDGDLSVCVDSTKLAFYEGAGRLGGDALKLVEMYYRRVIHMVKTQTLDIVGHLDLPTKLNKDDCLFDTKSERYQKAVIQAVDTIAQAGKIVEINTGAYSRGITSEPYPAYWIIKECVERGVRLTVSSDSHSESTLGFAFDEIENLLRGMGCAEIWQLTDNGFCAVPL